MMRAALLTPGSVHMRIAVKATLATIAAVAVVTVGYLTFNSATPRESTVPIPDSALIGFERCNVSNEFIAIMDDLFAHGHPISKENGKWVYAINGRFMGLEIRRLELGVCNSSGERGCGWAVYTGLGIDSPKETVRALLKDKTGIDFTEAHRDNEADATMRPLLSARPNSTSSLLFCDPGQL
jgi:hypothetical protein